jgi:hypothetical protein
MIQKPHRVNFNFTLNWIFPPSPAAKEYFPRVLEYTFPTEFPATTSCRVDQRDRALPCRSLNRDRVLPFIFLRLAAEEFIDSGFTG